MPTTFTACDEATGKSLPAALRCRTQTSATDSRSMCYVQLTSASGFHALCCVFCGAELYH
eukprot:1354157-Rhodomonas_salina.1